MNKYALNDHSVTCPACLAEYSKLDSPHEYARVLHIVDPCHDQKERVAKLSAEILAKDKLPSMTPEEEGELRANLELKDLSLAEQEQVRQYTGTNYCIYEQVSVALQDFGVDANFNGYNITVELVEKDCSLLFSHGAVTWEGFGYFAPLAHWVSDVPNSCTDVPRITKSIFNWIKRFDYREYRGNK